MIRGRVSFIDTVSNGDHSNSTLIGGNGNVYGRFGIAEDADGTKFLVAAS